MMHRIHALILVLGLAISGCGLAPGGASSAASNADAVADAGGNTDSATNPSGAGGAVIVGQVTSSAATGKLLAAQEIGCSDIVVTIGGSPVDIEFDDDCAFLINEVQPAVLVDVRLELMDLGVVGTVELSDVIDGELIEILVEVRDDSLSVTVARRTAPEPSDELPAVVDGNNISIRITAGLYGQGLEVQGNNFTLVGEAGVDCDDVNGWTVITGAVLVQGNNATFRNIRFDGPVELHGNNARFINCCFGDRLVIFGNNAEVNDDDDKDGDHDDEDDDKDDDDDGNDDDGDDDSDDDDDD